MIVISADLVCVYECQYSNGYFIECNSFGTITSFPCLVIQYNVLSLLSQKETWQSWLAIASKNDHEYNNINHQGHCLIYHTTKEKITRKLTHLIKFKIKQMIASWLLVASQSRPLTLKLKVKVIYTQIMWSICKKLIQINFSIAQN